MVGAHEQSRIFVLVSQGVFVAAESGPAVCEAIRTPCGSTHVLCEPNFTPKDGVHLGGGLHLTSCEPVHILREALPPVWERVLPVCERVPPVREALPPVCERVPPVCERVPPVCERVPPVRECIPPVCERVPTSQGNACGCPLVRHTLRPRPALWRKCQRPKERHCPFGIFVIGIPELVGGSKPHPIENGISRQLMLISIELSIGGQLCKRRSK